MEFKVRKALLTRIRELLEPVVEMEGCELVGLEFGFQSGGLILRIFIDKPGGIQVGDCARISKACSPELDVEDPIESRYRLEVSSPGIERPVERPEDFERFAGYRARIKMGPDAPRRKYKGVLRGIEGELIKVEVDSNLVELNLAQVDRVRLELSTEEFMELGAAIPKAAQGETR
jgi:ribosome maturation factor RimP